MRKIAIITSHPIQYNSPLFASLAKESEIELMVFYTWGEEAIGAKYDPDFKKTIAWDIPLLEGYSYTFVRNTSKEPGSHHFKGIINPSLIQEIEVWGAEVVWVWGWAFNSHLQTIRHFKGKIPVWFRGDSTLLDEPNGFSLKKMARRLFLYWVYKHIDKAFYVGTHNMAYFKKHGITDMQLVEAPHAIDNHRFADADGSYKRRAKEWRQQLGIPNDCRVLLFAGKFESKKNPMFFVSLIRKLKSSNYFGIMVGNGSLESVLKKNASDNLLFLPFQNQSVMPVVYRLADALVIPSIGPGETWGLAINEALACHIPVFASLKCGGTIDLVPDKWILDISNMSNSIVKIEKALGSSHDSYDVFATVCAKHSYATIIDAITNEIISQTS